MPYNHQQVDRSFDTVSTFKSSPQKRFKKNEILQPENISFDQKNNFRVAFKYRSFFER
jgi:hypothetical protein